MRFPFRVGSHPSGTQVPPNRHTVRATRAPFPATIGAWNLSL